MSEENILEHNLKRIKLHLTIAKEWTAMIDLTTTNPRKIELNEVAVKNITKSVKIMTAATDIIMKG
jgi:hypothetical protein